MTLDIAMETLVQKKKDTIGCLYKTGKNAR